MDGNLLSLTDFVREVVGGNPLNVPVWWVELGLQVLGSLVPRPCAFVACSTKFAQRAWARSSRDVCRSLRHVHSTGINDVIDELAPSLALKEAHRDHSNGSCANLRKC